MHFGRTESYRDFLVFSFFDNTFIASIDGDRRPTRQFNARGADIALL
jgi:hypothetical protein